jgi:hypothetical protein
MIWEYRVEPISFGDVDIARDAMNSMAREGWELVAIVPNATGKEETWPVAVYKRPTAVSGKSN